MAPLSSRHMFQTSWQNISNTIYKVNWHIFPNVYIWIEYILPTILCCIGVLVYLYNYICALNNWEYDFWHFWTNNFPNFPNFLQFARAQFGPKNSGAQFAVKKIPGPNLPRPNLPRPHLSGPNLPAKNAWGPIFLEPLHAGVSAAFISLMATFVKVKVSSLTLAL